MRYLLDTMIEHYQWQSKKMPFSEALGACLIQQHDGKDQPIAFASKSHVDVKKTGMVT